MPRKRKKKPEPHVNHERWLVSYADFVTLLFAFFVVMFASSQVDSRKVSKLAEAIQTAFQQLGIFDTAYRQPPLEPNGSTPAAQMKLVDSNMNPEQMFAAMSSAAQNAAEKKSLQQIRTELDKNLAPEIHRRVVAIQENREGLVISLREIGFYPSGSATLKPSSEPAVRRIAMVLRQYPDDIRFEGHTDNVPIHNAQFSSNWELSVARATDMLRLFITRYGFNPAKLSAAGYAQYHPVASNTTPAGRARNRRVDIVVLGPPSPFESEAVNTPGVPSLDPPATPEQSARKTKGPAADPKAPPVGEELQDVVPHGKPKAVSPAAVPKTPLPQSGKPPPQR